MEDIIVENYPPMIEAFSKGERVFHLEGPAVINGELVTKRLECKLILPHHDKIVIIGFENLIEEERREFFEYIGNHLGPEDTRRYIEVYLELVNEILEMR